MLHASCLGACYFLSFRGQHGWGEAWGDAGAWERWAATPARCSGEPKVGNHLLERLLRFFSSHKGVFVGELSHWIAKLASPAWGWDPQPRHPRLLGRWDATLGWAAPTGTSYVAGAGKRSYNVRSLFQRQHYYFFSFQTLQVGKEKKLTAPKNTSHSPLSGESFHIPLVP